jgi:hypothetical protein
VLVEPLDQRFYEAELHRMRGVVMLAEGADCETSVASLDRVIAVLGGGTRGFSNCARP